MSDQKWDLSGHVFISAHDIVDLDGRRAGLKLEWASKWQGRVPRLKLYLYWLKKDEYTLISSKAAADHDKGSDNQYHAYNGLNV